MKTHWSILHSSSLFRRFFCSHNKLHSSIALPVCKRWKKSVSDKKCSCECKRARESLINSIIQILQSSDNVIVRRSPYKFMYIQVQERGIRGSLWRSTMSAGMMCRQWSRRDTATTSSFSSDHYLRLPAPYHRPLRTAENARLSTYIFRHRLTPASLGTPT